VKNPDVYSVGCSCHVALSAACKCVLCWLSLPCGT